MLHHGQGNESWIISSEGVPARSGQFALTEYCSTEPQIQILLKPLLRRGCSSQKVGTSLA
jgi:hypothetical protein